MTERIALIGGDEFRPGCEEVDRAIIDATGVDKPKVLVAPTAAAHYDPAQAAANGVRYFMDLGADAAPLMVLDSADADDEGLVSQIESADVIYLSGGSPAHLFDTLNGSLALRKMLQAHGRGAWLAGSSAGAMVLGTWMRFHEWTRALDIAGGIATFPHHEHADPEATSTELARGAPDGVSAVLGIDGRTGCVSSAEGWTAFGAGSVTVYEAGSWRRFASGQSFTLGAG